MENVSSNKKGKKILCYISLVVLIILLILPPVFRLVFKEEKVEEKKDIVEILKCNNEKETVISSFLNSEPQRIQYTINGNYALNEEEKENVEEGPSVVLVKLSGYATLKYDEEKNITSMNFNPTKAKGTIDYDVIFANVGLQAEYFKSHDFNCSKQISEQ